jgi:acyl carrier protein
VEAADDPGASRRPITGSQPVKEENFLLSIAEEVRGIIAEIAEVDPGEIGDDTPLREALKVDSMMVLEIMSAIEANYDIKIPDEMSKEFTSLSAIVSALSDGISASA